LAWIKWLFIKRLERRFGEPRIESQETRWAFRWSGDFDFVTQGREFRGLVIKLSVADIKNMFCFREKKVQQEFEQE